MAEHETTTTAATVNWQDNTPAAVAEIQRLALLLLTHKNAEYADAWRAMRYTSLLDRLLVKVQRALRLEATQAPVDRQADQLFDIVNEASLALVQLIHAHGVDAVLSGSQRDPAPAAAAAATTLPTHDTASAAAASPARPARKVVYAEGDDVATQIQPDLARKYEEEVDHLTELVQTGQLDVWQAQMALETLEDLYPGCREAFDVWYWLGGGAKRREGQHGSAALAQTIAREVRARHERDTNGRAPGAHSRAHRRPGQ